MIHEKLVLDTDIVIHLLKKQPQIIAKFINYLEFRTILLLSPVVISEVYAGAFEREYQSIEYLFNLCEHIAIDADIGRKAGKYANFYRKAYQGISLEDYILAATAWKYSCPLWTCNHKHYPMKDITLIDLT